MYNHQLDTFLSVCKYGSFTLAAKKCFITPSAVVQQINLLEKSIGVKLFLRTNHGVALTPSGEILRKEAPHLIEHAHDITTKMKNVSDHRQIRLGWSTGVEDPLFLSECLSLRDAHKGLQIDLARISNGVLDGLAQNEFDLCQYVEIPRAAQYGYVFTPLYSDRQCIVLPPEHPLEHLSSVGLEDLNRMSLVLLAPGVLTDHDAFRALVQKSGISIHLIEVDQYDFQTQSLCYAHKLPFLGMMPLSNQYQPLTCLPARWDIPVHLGLLSRSPAWDDLALLVREITRRLRKDTQNTSHE